MTCMFILLKYCGNKRKLQEILEFVKTQDRIILEGLIYAGNN